MCWPPGMESSRRACWWIGLRDLRERRQDVMAINCGLSWGACVVRLTRVDAQGNVIAGNNSYVSNQLISLAQNPNIETGNTFSARNGCGCGLARFKAPDIFNWWEF